MLIFEPCNYASNMAYYHSVTRTCDYPDWSITELQQKGFRRVHSILAVGSAMMHGSHTNVGQAFDVNMIGFVAYACYQVIIANFPGDSHVLKQLNPTPRNQTFDEVTTNLLVAFRDQEVEQWIDAMQDADIQMNFMIVFAAITASGLSVIFPWFITEKIVTTAITNFPHMG